MSSIEKTKAWIKENAPMLAGIYENKYVGMLYDHFASLDSRKQKQLIIGIFSFGILMIVLFLLSSYLELWNTNSKSKQAREMISLLQRYQGEQRAQSSEIDSLERNARLAGPGEFKRYLNEQAKLAGISPRSTEVKEEEGAVGTSNAKVSSDVRTNQATVVLMRINLAQLKNFLAALEGGMYTLSISSIRITNDDKVRGYMKAEIGIIAYSFVGEENS